MMEGATRSIGSELSETSVRRLSVYMPQDLSESGVCLRIRQTMSKRVARCSKGQ